MTTIPGARQRDQDAGHVTRFERNAYIRSLEDVDQTGALQVAERCRDRSVSRDTVIEELFGPAQVEVGLRWENGEWSVADEHAATSITAAALTAQSFLRPAPSRGLVVVVCAEHEWHALPARMAGDRLAERGWRVMHLGASMPPGDLGAFLGGRQPVGVVVVSASPMSLAPARHTIEAAHEAGLRVLAGGAGFGDTNMRAIRIGADAWAGTIDAAHRVLETWEAIPSLPPPPPPPPDPEADALARSAHEISLAMADRLADDYAAPSERLPDQARMLEHGSMTLQALAAALVTGDQTIVADFLAWLRRVTAARNAPDGYVESLVRALRVTIASTPEDTSRIDALIGAIRHPTA